MRRGQLLAIPLGMAALLLLRGQGTTPANSYVDSRKCAECHSQIARTYPLTGMGRSFYRPRAGKEEEDFTKGNPFHHMVSDTWYAMEQRGGVWYQRRWRLGPGGKEMHVQESRIDYVMGSGNHAKTY